MSTYITASIPYVNAKPHLGHLMEFLEADALVRWYKQKGQEVRFISGSDEHALKIVYKAEEAGESIESYCARHAKIFSDLSKSVDVEFDQFLRTSSPEHHKSSQELWKRCANAGDIYLKEYTGMYCVGCEQFYTKEELDENGECFEHPGKPLDQVSEKNYFFRLSKYRDQLIELIESDTFQILPEIRKNETLQFLRGDVHDFSISRTNERAKGWGVPVPGDPDQVMYVWFDALNLYQTGVGFSQDEEMYAKWWPADWHVIGKGILRFHSIYWPAMLLSAGLPLPKRIAVHGYLTMSGMKMSKSLGNVIDPVDFITRYGSEGFRYLLLAEVSTFEDSDVTVDRFDEAYTAQLANGIGNLCSRITSMAEKLELSIQKESISIESEHLKERDEQLERFNVYAAAQAIIKQAAQLDKTISDQKPWTMDIEAQRVAVTEYIQELVKILYGLEPFLPKTVEKVRTALFAEKVQKVSALFPRLQESSATES